MVLKQIFLQIILVFSSLTMSILYLLPSGIWNGIKCCNVFASCGLKLNIYFRSCHLVLQ